MTLVVDHGAAGPATHALVIGVPHYRHLPGGTGPFLRRDYGLRQLQAPLLSVAQLVDFLVDEYRRSLAPLGTVEVLLGSDSGAPATVRGTPVEPPTMANVTAAVQRWSDRCSGSPDDVALFYFCGHGLEREHQLLLMEDFGAHEGSLLQNALDVDALHLGMARCPAGTQLFLVDACRELPRDLFPLVSGVAQGVLDARLDGNLPRDAPILRAAARGRKAFAAQGQSTQFLQALVQALRGGGAQPDLGGAGWVVRYNALAGAVASLLAQAPTEHRQTIRTGGEAGDALVHELPGPPLVPVVIDCDPAVRAEIATLQLEALGGGPTYARQPAPGSWQVQALPDIYQLRAVVTPPYQADPQRIQVWPPLKHCRVAVRS